MIMKSTTDWEFMFNLSQVANNKFVEENAALREELAALRAENAKLNSVVCQTCHGAGSVCSAQDDCYNCPECVAPVMLSDSLLEVLESETPAQSLAKVRTDAIRSVTEQGFEYSVEHGPWGNDWAISLDAISDYANKIEDGS